MKTQLQINIFNQFLEWKGAVDAVEHLIHRTSWHEITNSQLSISKKAAGVQELKIGRILVINNRLDKPLLIVEMEASLDDNYWLFTCTSLKEILNYRIAHPEDSGSWSGVRQSVVMRELVRNNVVTQDRVPSRRFWNENETANMLRMGAIKQLGEEIDFTTDWDSGLMGDVITGIAKMHDENSHPLGWNIYILENLSQFEMDVYQTTNRSISQTDRPPVVFSEEFGNIKNATYIYSVKDWRNMAYISWKDSDNVDRMNFAHNRTNGDTRSWNRREIVVHSLKEVQGEASLEGRLELNRRPHVESFTAEIINNENTLSTFEVDWFLGDIVTVQSKEIIEGSLLSLDAQITEIEEIYSNGEYSINATFGESKLNIFQLIKNEVKKR